jgi:hypothetical protein
MGDTVGKRHSDGENKNSLCLDLALGQLGQQIHHPMVAYGDWAMSDWF